jgi:hypothetical protein
MSAPRPRPPAPISKENQIGKQHAKEIFKGLGTFLRPKIGEGITIPLRRRNSKST